MEHFREIAGRTSAKIVIREAFQMAAVMADGEDTPRTFNLLGAALQAAKEIPIGVDGDFEIASDAPELSSEAQEGLLHCAVELLNLYCSETQHPACVAAQNVKRLLSSSLSPA